MALICTAQPLRPADFCSITACVQDLCRDYNIPTGSYEVFRDPEPAKSYIMEQGAPIVVKAVGLAAGKGVVVAQTVDEATAAVHDMLVQRRFGEAGNTRLWRCNRSRVKSFLSRLWWSLLHLGVSDEVWLEVHLPRLTELSRLGRLMSFFCSGSEVVVEEFLDGEEASFFALIDGENCVALASAQVISLL